MLIAAQRIVRVSWPAPLVTAMPASPAAAIPPTAYHVAAVSGNGVFQRSRRPVHAARPPRLTLTARDVPDRVFGRSAPAPVPVSAFSVHLDSAAVVITPIMPARIRAIVRIAMSIGNIPVLRAAPVLSGAERWSDRSA